MPVETTKLDNTTGTLTKTSTGTGSLGTKQSTTKSTSDSYIPDYSTTPILESISKYAEDLAPQVYKWGLDQYDSSKGDIDTLMRNALTYASPSRIAQGVGMAESGSMQASEAGRKSAIKDLEDLGIDPSSGRYASLDWASRVAAGAAAAGAGNVQRESDIALGNTMQNQAISAGLTNTQTGYSAGKGANELLTTASSLKYPPLGTTSKTDTQSTEDTASGTALGTGTTGTGTTTKSTGTGTGTSTTSTGTFLAYGGKVPDQSSPSDGADVDDVPANLTAGEFVIPKDVAEWKGQEFFYKLMAQVRKMRATNGSGNGEMSVGYGAN